MKTNIFSNNIYAEKQLDEEQLNTYAKKFLEFYLTKIKDLSCLQNQKYKIISFDFLYCDSKKTHEINKEYRKKDYPADIITFAIFADSEEHFVFDGEINLGEIIIALDKVQENADKNGTSFDYELVFLISHGIMHLLGFDHQTEEDYNFVIDMQQQALKSIGL